MDEGSLRVAAGVGSVDLSVRTRDWSPLDLDHDIFLAWTVLVLVDLLTNGMLAGTGSWLGAGSGQSMVTFSTVSVAVFSGGMDRRPAGG